jgi:hypothetical protein
MSTRKTKPLPLNPVILKTVIPGRFWNRFEYKIGNAACRTLEATGWIDVDRVSTHCQLQRFSHFISQMDVELSEYHMPSLLQKRTSALSKIELIEGTGVVASPRANLRNFNIGIDCSYLNSTPLLRKIHQSRRRLIRPRSRTLHLKSIHDKLRRILLPLGMPILQMRIKARTTCTNRIPNIAILEQRRLREVIRERGQAPESQVWVAEHDDGEDFGLDGWWDFARCGVHYACALRVAY